MIRMRTRLILSLAVLVLTAPVARANQDIDIRVENSDHGPWSGIRVEIRLNMGQAWQMETNSDGVAEFQALPLPMNGDMFTIILEPDDNEVYCTGYAFRAHLGLMGGDYILIFESPLTPPPPGFMLCAGGKMGGFCNVDGGIGKGCFTTNHYYLPTVVPCN